MSRRKAYIAGPMRGYPRFNFDEFERAARMYRLLGYEVLSPAEMDLEAGFDPDQSLESQPHINWIDRVWADIEAILVADLVVVLPGWEQSRGATLEVALARRLGIPVFEAWTGKEVIN